MKQHIKKYLIFFITLIMIICSVSLNVNRVSALPEVITQEAEYEEEQLSFEEKLEKINTNIKTLKNDFEKNGGIEEGQKYVNALDEKVILLQEKVEELDSNISKMNSQIKKFENDIPKLKEKISNLEQEIDTKQKELNNNTNEYYKNLRDLYVLESSGKSGVISNKNNMINEIVDNTSDLEEKKKELTKDKKELEQKESSYNIFKMKLQVRLDKITLEKNEYEKEKKEAAKILKQLQKENGLTNSNWIYPVKGYTTLSAGFPNYSNGNYHGGLDFPAPSGTTIMASNSGTVILAENKNNGYGNHVMIDHGNGVISVYGHMSKICCNVGDYVARGQKIGEVGTTGRSTGNHCHLEIRINGERVNPLNYIKK